jgi:hypothetical protein
VNENTLTYVSITNEKEHENENLKWIVLGKFLQIFKNKMKNSIIAEIRSQKLWYDTVYGEQSNFGSE